MAIDAYESVLGMKNRKVANILMGMIGVYGYEKVDVMVGTMERV